MRFPEAVHYWGHTVGVLRFLCEVLLCLTTCPGDLIELVPLVKKRRKKKEKGRTLHITGSTRVRFVCLARGVASSFTALPCVAQRDVVVLALRNKQRSKGCFTSGIS